MNCDIVVFCLKESHIPNFLGFCNIFVYLWSFMKFVMFFVAF